MPLHIYNTLTRKKELFKPINPKEVKFYGCGPTVYAMPHIGNFKSFVMYDTLRRALEFLGYKVKFVMNITDIDDKTIRDSAKEGKTLKEFTEFYTKEFMRGLDILNIMPADVYPKATETVPEMIIMTKHLIDTGHAYEKDGSVYYRISSFKEYGKLSKIDLSNIKVGASVDVDEYDKENPQDFALLKKSSPEEIERGICYHSPWGLIRPGWHIECSAMSMKELGETLDLHTGGIDLVFPHHENEIAQSEAYTGKPFVNYWVHGEHLLVNSEKMSKSKGNYFTLEDLLEKYNGEVIRYMFISTHYRKQLNYTDGFAKNALDNYNKLWEARENLRIAIERACDETQSIDAELIVASEKLLSKFRQAIEDDLNTPLALSNFHALAKEINSYIDAHGKNKNALMNANEVFDEMSGVLGLFEKKEETAIDKDIEMLIEKREAFRKAGKYKESDELRAQLLEKGIVLEDSKDGVVWKRKKR